MKTDIVEHLGSLVEEFQKYFPYLYDCECKMIRSPFTSNISVDKLPQTIQDEFLDLQND
jgi:hypothetical protein